MRELLPGLWYHVRTDAPEGAQATPRMSLEQLAERLPHGSGLDGNWFVSIRRRGQGITLTTEYHAMNQDGYYVGWYPVRVVLSRTADHGLEVKSIRINDRATNGAGDWIADCLHEAIRETQPETVGA